MIIHGISRPKPGEIECGDNYTILQNGNEWIVALADGLGHGPKAAEASSSACSCIQQNIRLSPEQIILECDGAISHTRGAALTVLKIDAKLHKLAYAGVGNVEMISKSLHPIRPNNYPGIVGNRIRRLRELSYTLSEGDLLILYSDGISSRFDIEKYKHLDVQTMAERILHEKAKDHDDATCIAIRY